MANRQCEECGCSEALARSWYEVSPVTGERTKEGGWCGGCYEKLHTRHIREVYRKRDEQVSMVNGKPGGRPVQYW